MLQGVGRILSEYIMQKNQISAILIALGVLVVFSNWGKVADATEAMLRQEHVRPRKVVYWTSSGSPEVELNIANNFMQEHEDIFVQPNFRETGGLQDILYISFLSGNPPDYMDAQLHELRQYALFGGVRPFDDLLAAEGPGYFDEFLDGRGRVYRFETNPDDRFFARDAEGNFLHPKEAARLLNLSGKAVGLRNISMPDTLTYNKRVFREAAAMFPEAGLVDENGEPVPPRTWWEFYETARVISEYGRRAAEERGEAQPLAYGLVIQGERTNDLMRGIRPLARCAGSMAFEFTGDAQRIHQHFDLETPQGRAAAARYENQPIAYFDYEHPAYLASFALLLQMRREQLILPGMESRHYEDVRTALATGQAGMLLDGWHAALIGVERVPWAADDIGSAPVPIPYPAYDEDDAQAAEAVARQKAAIESLLQLDVLGIEVPPGNKLPRGTGDAVSFLTSLARDADAAWTWIHYGVKDPEVVQRNTRRGSTPMVRVALENLGDREWFPYAYQPQVYELIQNETAMWPSPAQHGPVPVPSEQEIFFRLFHRQDDRPLAEVLQEARADLARFSDAANQDLARRIADGVTRPDSWTFPEFTPQRAPGYFEQQQNQADNPEISAQLRALREDFLHFAAAHPRHQDLLDPDTQDLRADLWMYAPAGNALMVLWVPGLMLITICLWFVVNALRNRKRRREWWQQTCTEAKTHCHGYLFVLPAMILLFFFAIYPSLYQFYIAMHRGDGLGAMQPVGLDNFARVLNPRHPRFDAVFWSTVIPNTLTFMLVVTTAQVVFGLMIASLLNLPLRSNSIYRVLFFIPLVTSLAVVSVIFIGLLKGEDSGVNQFLISMGWENLPYRLGLVGEPGQMINWLGETTGLWAVMFVAAWHGMPYNIILLLAGLQSISPQLYEAARVDGASAWQRFRHVTIPELLPILIIITFQAFIGAAKAFSVVFVLTEGGINHSSELVSTYIFRWGFMRPAGREADLGYASALGIVYSVLLAGLTLANVIIIARRWKKRLDVESAVKLEPVS